MSTGKSNTHLKNSSHWLQSQETPLTPVILSLTGRKLGQKFKAFVGVVEEKEPGKCNHQHLTTFEKMWEGEKKEEEKKKESAWTVHLESGTIRIAGLQLNTPWLCQTHLELIDANLCFTGESCDLSGEPCLSNSSESFVFEEIVAQTQIAEGWEDRKPVPKAVLSPPVWFCIKMGSSVSPCCFH